MKTISHQNKVYPHLDEIPAPLEIHPSVKPELASALMTALEQIESDPSKFDISIPHFDKDGRGCFYCFMKRNGYNPDPTNEGFGFVTTDAAPKGHPARIYSAWHWHMWDIRAHGNINADGLSHRVSSLRIARINHFLATGE